MIGSLLRQVLDFPTPGEPLTQLTGVVCFFVGVWAAVDR